SRTAHWLAVAETEGALVQWAHNAVLVDMPLIERPTGVHTGRRQRAKLSLMTRQHDRSLVCVDPHKLSLGYVVGSSDIGPFAHGCLKGGVIDIHAAGK